MGEGAFVSISEFARLIGISRGSVQFAIRKGRITCKTKGRKKLIDPVVGKKQWAASINKRASDNGKKGKGKKKTKTTKVESPKPYEPHAKKDSDGEMTASEAERREKVYRSQLSELKYLEQKGNLLRKEDVQREAFEVGRETRDALMTIPTRFAHELAVETDPHKLETKLTKLMQKALEKLINQGKKYE